MDMITVTGDVKACNLVKGKDVSEKTVVSIFRALWKWKQQIPPNLVYFVTGRHTPEAYMFKFRFPWSYQRMHFAFTSSSLNYALSNSESMTMKVKITGNNELELTCK